MKYNSDHTLWVNVHELVLLLKKLDVISKTASDFLWAYNYYNFVERVK